MYVSYSSARINDRFHRRQRRCGWLLELSKQREGGKTGCSRASQFDFAPSGWIVIFLPFKNICDHRKFILDYERDYSFILVDVSWPRQENMHARAQQSDATIPLAKIKNVDHEPERSVMRTFSRSGLFAFRTIYTLCHPGIRTSKILFLRALSEQSIVVLWRPRTINVPSIIIDSLIYTSR